MRGNRQIVAKSTSTGRSIPACAGEPLLLLGCNRADGVYPRVCGGTCGLTQAVLWAEGLSPRVRGNRMMLPTVSDSERSIPACAGEPLSHRAVVGKHQVYPRVCGGTLLSCMEPFAVSGLSPRVRGNLSLLISFFLSCGSIPACAGEPCSALRLPPVLRVYPRVCGGTQPVARSII